MSRGLIFLSNTVYMCFNLCI